eukprot:362201-Chlamydomonas_euryale.AAC.9
MPSVVMRSHAKRASPARYLRHVRQRRVWTRARVWTRSAGRRCPAAPGRLPGGWAGERTASQASKKTG